MTGNLDQIPSGGCENCGGPVRTRKGGAWVCSKCQRQLEGAVFTEPEPDLHRDVRRAVAEYERLHGTTQRPEADA